MNSKILLWQTYKYIFLKYRLIKAAKIDSDRKKKEDSLTNISLRFSKKRRILSVRSVTSEVAILEKRTIGVRVLEDYFITNFNISDTSSEENKIFLSKVKNDVNCNINSKD